MRRRLIASSILAIAAGGCSGPVITHMQNEDRDFVSSFFRYEAADGVVPVEIYGAPRGVDPAGYAAAVAAGIQPPMWEPPARFQPVEQGGAPFRMVLMMGVPANVGGQRACADPAKVGLFPDQAPLRVQGAMCSGGDALTSALATLDPPPDGPQDPRFRAMLYQLAVALMPEPRKEADGFVP